MTAFAIALTVEMPMSIAPPAIAAVAPEPLVNVVTSTLRPAFWKKPMSRA
jgi:hypothetical protein